MRMLAAAAATLFSLTTQTATATPVTVLFQEDFNSVSGPWTGGDPQRFGVPTTNGNTDASSVTIGNADNDWYAARFEAQSRNDPAYNDVGAQQIGGYPNNTVVGLIEDDAGLIVGIDARGYTSIHVEFDWRTHQAESGDRFVYGYYAGDLLSNAASVYNATARTFDLRNAATGGVDGEWNWGEQSSGHEGAWVEQLRGGPQTSWAHAMFDLAGTENGLVWIAFWLDNGEDDFGKVDNIVVTGVSTVPLPAALPLLLSGLAGLALWPRRGSWRSAAARAHSSRMV